MSPSLHMSQPEGIPYTYIPISPVEQDIDMPPLGTQVKSITPVVEGKAPRWKPLALKTPFILFFFLVTVSLIAVIEVLYQKSQRDKALIFIGSLDDLTPFQQFCYRYLLTIISVSYGMVWASVDLDIKRLEPFFQLSRKKGATAANSILLHYPFDFLATVPLTALARRHYSVFSSGFALILIFWVITPMQAALLTTAPVKRNVQTQFIASMELIPFSGQSAASTVQYLYNSYGTLFLGEQMQPWTNDSFFAMPFKPLDAANVAQEGMKESWTTTTRLYSTNLDCTLAQTVSNSNGKFMFANGDGCTSKAYTPLTGEGSRNIMYNSELGNFEIILFSTSSSTSSSCVKDSSKVTIIWAQREPGNSNKTGVTAIMCKPSYSYTDAKITVDSETYLITSITPGKPIAFTQEDEIIDVENFEAFMGSLTSPANAVFSTTKAPTKSNLLGLSSPIGPVSYSLGMSPDIKFEDLKDPNVLAETFNKGQKYLFASYASSLLQNTTTGGTPRPGYRTVSSIGVVVIQLFARLLEGFLAAVAICFAFLGVITFRRHANLFSDPDSLAAKMALVADSKPLLEDFKGLDESPELKNLLLDRIYRLEKWDSSGYYRIDLEENVNSGSGTNSPTGSVAGSPVGSPGGSPAGSLVGSPAGSPGGSPVGPPTGSPMGSPAGSPIGSPLGSTTGSPVGPPVGSSLGSPVGSPVGPPTGSPTGSSTNSPTGAPAGSTTGSTINSLRPSVPPDPNPKPTPRPLVLRTSIGVLLVLFLLLLFSFLIYMWEYARKNNGLPTFSKNQIVVQIIFSIVPTVLATGLEPLWVLITRYACVYQPYTELYKGRASSTRSISTKYTNVPPALVLFRALKSKHFILFSLSATSLLCNLLAVSLGGLFDSEPRALDISQNFTQTISPQINALKNEQTRPAYEGNYTDHFASDTSTYSVATFLNFTQGSHLPAWVAGGYYFLPFEWDSSENSSDLHTATTRGFGLSLDCDRFEGDIVVGKRGYEFNVTLPVDDGRTVVCTIPDYGGRLYEYHGDPGTTLAGEFNFNLMPAVAEEVDDDALRETCKGVIFQAWAKAVRADLRIVEDSLEYVAAVCKQKINTAMFEVKVDGEQKVQSYKKTGADDDVAEFFNGTITPRNFTVKVSNAILGGAPRYDTIYFQNGTNFRQSWITFLIGKAYLPNISDPLSPLPDFDTVTKALSDIWGLQSALLISTNSEQVFFNEPTPKTINGVTTATVTRVVMDKVMFYITAVILMLNAIVGVIAYTCRPKNFLPRFPDTLASEIAYFYSSQALRDVSGTTGMTSSVRDRHLVRLGHRYGFGYYEAEDFSKHRGVERSSILEDYMSYKR